MAETGMALYSIAGLVEEARDADAEGDSEVMWQRLEEAVQLNDTLLERLNAWEEGSDHGRNYAVRANISLDVDKPLVEIARALSNAEEIGARVQLKAKEHQVYVLIPAPSSLRNAPAGTHEFARGWLMGKIQRDIEHVFTDVGATGMIEWEWVDIDPQTHRILRVRS